MTGRLPVRSLALLTILIAAPACSPSTSPDSKGDPLGVPALRVRDCEGAATSLPAALVAQLPPRQDPRTGALTSDAEWAALAQVPGGYAGGFSDDQGRPVLLLTDPTRAAAAKAALAPLLKNPNFDLARAEVRPARWTYTQLQDWYMSLLVRQPLWRPEGFATSIADVPANRIRYGVLTTAARDQLVANLGALDLPCDLVLVDVVP